MSRRSEVPYQRQQSGFAGLLLKGDDSRSVHEIVLPPSYESALGSLSHRSNFGSDEMKGAACLESDDSNMMRGLSLDEEDTEPDIGLCASSCTASRFEAGKERWRRQSQTELISNCCALERPGKDIPASNCLDGLYHLDYKWLLERCDDDSTFVCEVLETLDQDGSYHVAQIRKALSDHSFEKAVFHAVILASVV